MDGKPLQDLRPRIAPDIGRDRTGMAQPAMAEADSVDLGDLILRLWQGKVVIALMAALGAAVGAFVIANTYPTYRADALLQLEEKAGALALPGNLSAALDNDPRSVTEIEILRSRMVLGQAVADQNLDWRIVPDVVPAIGTILARHRLTMLDPVIPDRFIRPGESITVDSLIVPPTWLNRDIAVVVVDAASYALTLPDGRRLTGTVGQRLALDEVGFAIVIASIDAPAGRAFTIRQIDEIRAIRSLRDRLGVSERGRASGILELRLTGQDRRANAEALDAIMRAYLRQNIARSAAEAESSLSFIREQLPQAEQTLRDAEEALNAFRQQQVTIDLSIETQTILGQITRIEGELAGLDQREDELRQRYNPAHPTYRALLDERARLQHRLGDLRAQAGTLPETQRQILNLTRRVELAQRIHTELLTRAQEVEVLRASTVGNVRVVDAAAAEPNPVAPRRTLILALAALMGIMAGAGLVIARGWMRRGIRDATELEQMDLPVFATINYSPDADTGNRRKGRLQVLALEAPTDLTVEALRSLRTSLHFAMLDAPAPTLCITSSHPEAGKSFLSLNLAVVAAQAGQRVCLIDADMRRGQLRRYFDLPRDRPGLAEVIAGTCPIDAALVPGPVDNLMFLPAGTYPPNPSELLMRADFSSIVAWCGERFDLTLFDSPPVLAVTDPVVIARNTGAALFVARHDVTPPGEVEAAIKTFAGAGVRLSGAVLNGFDPRKAGGREGYGYGYRYDYRARTH